ncbi:acyltransferase [Iodobacter sp. LRB]|uniref:acyltransferase family protein n=1 Tax=unclassified Iodobacter TaxID=235634 RepID=UPI000C0ED101|nr:acyltransferase [Iodobacter sp. BJB302]PHV01219.1 acyltransferase [Iodobacter sp. BJB302]
MQKNNKLLGLEVLRFIAAFSVLIWHYQHFSSMTSSSSIFIINRQPFYGLLSFLYNYGFYAVQIFWGLSGYIFFWKYRDLLTGKKITGKMFFILRFARIYPLHFATLIFVFILQLIYFMKSGEYFIYKNNDSFHFILQLVMASNWGFESGSSFNGPIWSVSVEVFVYFVFYFVLRAFGPSAWVNVAIILLCGLSTIIKVHSSIFLCLAFFYTGGLTAIIVRKLDSYGGRNVSYVISCIYVLIVPFIFSKMNFFDSQSRNFIFLLLYLPMVLFILSGNYVIHPRMSKGVEIAGNMTYSSYLIHYPIQLVIVLFCILYKKEIPFYSNVFFLFFIFITFFCSYFIYKYFEFPMQSYFRKLLN